MLKKITIFPVLILLIALLVSCSQSTSNNALNTNQSIKTEKSPVLDTETKIKIYQQCRDDSDNIIRNLQNILGVCSNPAIVGMTVYHSYSQELNQLRYDALANAVPYIQPSFENIKQNIDTLYKYETLDPSIKNYMDIITPDYTSAFDRFNISNSSQDQFNTCQLMIRERENIMQLRQIFSQKYEQYSKEIELNKSSSN
ncbi:MAG: hypothetical protein AB1782_10955 [Cyanobacteriota bacterium]